MDKTEYRFKGSLQGSFKIWTLKLFPNTRSLRGVYSGSALDSANPHLTQGGDALKTCLERSGWEKSFLQPKSTEEWKPLTLFIRDFVWLEWNTAVGYFGNRFLSARAVLQTRCQKTYLQCQRMEFSTGKVLQILGNSNQVLEIQPWYLEQI